MTTEQMGLWEQIARADRGYWPGRNELPAVLWDAFAAGRFELDLDQLAVAIEDAWTSSEWPSRTLDHPMWVDMFETVGFLHNDSRASVPQSIPTLYRSEARLTHHGVAYSWAEGLSWTSQLETARWFHERNTDRFKFESRLLKIENPDPFSVLAHFETGRDESEWVLDPMYVYDDVEVME